MIMCKQCSFIIAPQLVLNMMLIATAQNQELLIRSTTLKALSGYHRHMICLWRTVLCRKNTHQQASSWLFVYHDKVNKYENA